MKDAGLKRLWFCNISPVDSNIIVQCMKGHRNEF